MRKPVSCLGENKGADQLREADQRLCFRYSDSTVPYLKPLAIFNDCTGQFVSDLVGNPEVRIFLRRGSFLTYCQGRMLTMI